MRPGRKTAAAVAVAAALAIAAARPTVHENTFKDGDKLELRVFLTDMPRFNAFNDTTKLVWHSKGFEYTAGFEAQTTTIEVPVTGVLLANGTLFAHTFVTKLGASPDPWADGYDRWSSTYAMHELVVYGERLKPTGLHNLLTKEPAPWEDELRRGLAAAAEAGKPEGEYISYWKPALRAQLLHDTVAHPYGEMPPYQLHYLQAMRLVQGPRYRPLIYVNELTVMRSHWMAINESVRGPCTLYPRPCTLDHVPCTLCRLPLP